MLSPVTHILPLTRIRRGRLLTQPGRVTARIGQKVNATDAVAESDGQPRHLLIDVRSALRLDRNVSLEDVMERRAGERVYAGDILAQTGGLFKKVVRSEVDGVIIHMGGGRVMIETPGEPEPLKAAYAGEVIEIIPERGVIIEGTGALVQGVLGNDHVEQGMLLVLAHSPDDSLTRERLDVSMRGAIVLAGFCDQADVFEVANEMPLRGMILGSVSADVLPAIAKAPYPIVVLEGVGRIPIDSTAYRILTGNEKRDICLNAAVWNPFTGERPEVFISLPAGADQAQESDNFKSGQIVRVLSAPYAGQVGQIARMIPGLTRLSNGLRAPAADVRLESSVHVIIPLANLDVLE